MRSSCALKARPYKSLFEAAGCRTRLNTFHSQTHPLRLSRPHQRLTSATSSEQRTFSAFLRTRKPRTISRPRDKRTNSTQSSPPPSSDPSAQKSLSISGRFKELSRKYGWAAVGVYFGLSLLDFPFCFLAVRLIGPDRIGEAEHAIVQTFWSAVGSVAPSMRPENKIAVEAASEAQAAEDAIVEDSQKQKEDASIWTQLLLAYGVHKSLIFFRVPLTAAVTPKVVKTLRSWGWNVGKPGNFKKQVRRRPK